MHCQIAREEAISGHSTPSRLAVCAGGSRASRKNKVADEFGGITVALRARGSRC